MRENRKIGSQGREEGWQGRCKGIRKEMREEGSRRGDEGRESRQEEKKEFGEVSRLDEKQKGGSMAGEERRKEGRE